MPEMQVQALQRFFCTATTRGKVMACESDKCEKYGMHHDYVNGIEVSKCQFCRRDDQPERLNPEDHFVDDNKMICDSLNSAET